MNPSVQCRIRWSVDTFVMWDNRAVQHFATDDFWPETRHVERVTVVGDAPFEEDTMAIGIHPLTASIGAEITGVDLADISTETAEASGGVARPQGAGAA